MKMKKAKGKEFLIIYGDEKGHLIIEKGSSSFRETLEQADINSHCMESNFVIVRNLEHLENEIQKYKEKKK
jgi:hypothetical protein